MLTMLIDVIGLGDYFD